MCVVTQTFSLSSLLRSQCKRRIKIDEGGLGDVVDNSGDMLVLWLLGFLGHVGGGMIHLLLVIAAIVLVINLVSGRRTV